MNRSESETTMHEYSNSTTWNDFKFSAKIVSRELWPDHNIRPGILQRCQVCWGVLYYNNRLTNREFLRLLWSVASPFQLASGSAWSYHQGAFHSRQRFTIYMLGSSVRSRRSFASRWSASPWKTCVDLTVVSQLVTNGLLESWLRTLSFRNSASIFSHSSRRDTALYICGGCIFGH